MTDEKEIKEIEGEVVSADDVVEDREQNLNEKILPAISARASEAGEMVKYDPLQRYLAEIRNIPPLTREEEHALAVRFLEKGDKTAGYKLVLANLRLVVMIAREYQRRCKNILDLIQEGNIGLLEAVKKFDPYEGTRFPSYAVYWVRAYMLRYLINNLRLVKIGTTQAQRKLFYNLQKEKAKLEAEGFVPEAALLAKRLNVKESEVIEMEQRLSLPELSVDAPLKPGEEGADFHNVLADDADTAEEMYAREEFNFELRNRIEKFKEELDEKERAIIDLRLFTEDPITLQEIADKFGLSRERIRQIEARLKEKMKDYLSKTMEIEGHEN